MNCNKANQLMMDYLDLNISEENEFLLKNHLKECEECKESFNLYTQILDEFSLDKENIIEAPEDFEIEVMKKIEIIEPRYIKEKFNKTMVYYTILGMTCLSFSLFLLISFNKDSFLSNVSNSPILNKYYLFFESMFNINIQKINIHHLWENITNLTPLILEGLKYTSLIMIFFIIIGQYFVYKRKSIKV